MYKQYLKEANNMDVFETSYGFFTYRLTPDVFEFHDLYILPEARGATARYDILKEFFTSSRSETHIDIYLDKEWGKPEEMRDFLRAGGFRAKSIKGTETIMTSKMNAFLEKLWHK